MSNASCARRPLNFLIRNRWESLKQIKKAAKVPMLLLSSLKVPYHALDRFSAVGHCVSSSEGNPKSDHALAGSAG